MGAIPMYTRLDERDESGRFVRDFNGTFAVPEVLAMFDFPSDFVISDNQASLVQRWIESQDDVPAAIETLRSQFGLGQSMRFTDLIGAIAAQSRVGRKAKGSQLGLLSGMLAALGESSKVPKSVLDGGWAAWASEDLTQVDAWISKARTLIAQFQPKDPAIVYDLNRNRNVADEDTTTVGSPSDVQDEAEEAFDA